MSVAISIDADRRLVTRCREDDPAAFEEIVRRHRGALERYCRRIVGPDLSEDVVQQALMSAYVALRSGDDRDLALKPWLYRVTRNAALDALRAERRRQGDELEEDQGAAPQPAQVLESRERVRDVVAAVGALPERQRDALVMQTFHGLSYQAIATTMGEDVPVVRQLIHRARGRVRSACAALVPLPLLRLLGRGPGGAGSDAVALKLTAMTAVVAIGAGGALHAAAPGARHAARTARATPAPVRDVVVAPSRVVTGSAAHRRRIAARAGARVTIRVHEPDASRIGLRRGTAVEPRGRMAPSPVVSPATTATATVARAVTTLSPSVALARGAVQASVGDGGADISVGPVRVATDEILR